MSYIHMIIGMPRILLLRQLLEKTFLEFTLCRQKHAPILCRYLIKQITNVSRICCCLALQNMLNSMSRQVLFQECTILKYHLQRILLQFVG